MTPEPRKPTAKVVAITAEVQGKLREQMPFSVSDEIKQAKRKKLQMDRNEPPRTVRFYRLIRIKVIDTGAPNPVNFHHVIVVKLAYLILPHTRITTD